MSNESEQLSQRSSIAIIGLSYPFRGGISHYTTILVRKLRQRHEVLFVSFRRQYPDFLFPGKTQFDYSEKSLAEPNERIVDSMNPVSWLKAARRLNHVAPDLIVFQWWHPYFAPAFGMIVRLLKPELRRRVCFLCHNVMPHEGNFLQNMLTRFAFGKTPYFIVHSQQDLDQLQALCPGRQVRKGCHPTYSEFGEWGEYSKEEARRSLNLEVDRNTILYFGLVRQYKGVKHLIEALPDILAERNCHLLIVGEFYDDKAQYVHAIDEAGVAESVTVIDQYVPNEEVAKYFRSADVVVLPYTSATQSGIVQIAFGLATPVITTNVGGLPEAVDHGKTGLIVEPANSSELADAVLRYYRDGLEEGFREEIKRQAKRFDWQEELQFLEEFVEMAGPR